MKDLFKKYDVPVPRYTSYPTVPYWSDSPTSEEWIKSLQETASQNTTRWSIYMHIPFCESLCTFCGCNTSITKDHGKEEPYVNLLHKEWALYKAKVPELLKRPLRQIHLGGGSPSFLSPENLQLLLKPFFADCNIDREHFEGSIEVDPRRTTLDQLATLREMGFNRVSMGVQDFNPEVQRLVNRHQPLEITRALTENARKLGYESVNFDLIYGLAGQTLETINATVESTIALKPDRIALYSLALVPWIKPAQRLFKDEDLPKADQKRALYDLARSKLISAGYVEIGMDHFSLPNEALNKARLEGSLHRNFMGYTDVRTEILLGLGVSSISESPNCFHQNEKLYPNYERMLENSQIPTHRGHKLTSQDRTQREKILKFMAEGSVALEGNEASDAEQFLREMLGDGLVKIENGKMELTDRGRPFLRNACVFFDKRLREQQPTTKVFSSAI